MKNTNLTEKNYRNPGPSPFRNVCTERPKQRFNVCPDNISADGPMEDLYERSLVLSLHEVIVPYYSTTSGLLHINVLVKRRARSTRPVEAAGQNAL
jgi:hypothetical protein